MAAWSTPFPCRCNMESGFPFFFWELFRPGEIDGPGETPEASWLRADVEEGAREEIWFRAVLLETGSKVGGVYTGAADVGVEWAELLFSELISCCSRSVVCLLWESENSDMVGSTSISSLIFITSSAFVRLAIVSWMVFIKSSSFPDCDPTSELSLKFSWSRFMIARLLRLLRLLALKIAGGGVAPLSASDTSDWETESNSFWRAAMVLSNSSRDEVESSWMDSVFWAGELNAVVPGDEDTDTLSKDALKVMCGVWLAAIELLAPASAWTDVAVDKAVWNALVGGAKLFRAEPKELMLKAGVADGGIDVLAMDSTSKVEVSSWLFDLKINRKF